MSNNLNECDDTFWNGSILGYWLKDRKSVV